MIKMHGLYNKKNNKHTIKLLGFLVAVFLCVFCYNQISVVHAGTSITDASGNAKQYTVWTGYGNTADGFVYFGSFPQTKVSRPAGATAANEVDGKVFTDANGDRYLFEKSYVTQTELVLDGGSWYKFEPIKWQIITVDASHRKIVLLSESIVDGMSFDTQNTTNVQWGGGPASGGKLSYPGIRLYLNSYDSSFYNSTGYYHYPWGGTSTLSYSSLTYNPHPNAEFKNQGFLEKAFTGDERNSLIKEANSTITNTSSPSAYDGDASNNSDLVRLISYGELYLSNLGFGSNGLGDGADGKRLGFPTEYAARWIFEVYNSEPKKVWIKSLNTSYDKYNTINRPSTFWLTKTNYGVDTSWAAD